MTNGIYRRYYSGNVFRRCNGRSTLSRDALRGGERKSMRKWLLAAFVAILALGGYQAGQASAYSGGLLDGKTMYYSPTPATSADDAVAIGTTVTDGSETTFKVIAKVTNGTTYSVRNLRGLDHMDITGYRIKGTPGSTSINLDFQRADGTNIARITNPNVTGTLVSVSYSNVYGIVLANTSTTADFTLYEMDVYGTYHDRTPPGAPTGLTASPGDSKAILSWTTPSGGDVIAGYNVYRGGVKVNTSLISANSYTVTGLANAASYSFQVSAVDTAGNESPKSTAVSVYLPDLDAPSKPTGINVTGTGLTATVTWNANTEDDLVGYNVYRDGSRINQETVTETSYEVAGLAPKTTYRFQVAAIDSDGNVSAFSDQASYTTPDVMSVNLVGNKDSIIVQISGGSPPFTIEWDGGSETVNATSYTIPGLLEDTDYVVTVSDSSGKVITQTVNTGHMKAFIPPVFPAPDGIFQLMLDQFGTAGTIAIAIIGGAVALGILCILALWGWRLLKRWLTAAR